MAKRINKTGKEKRKEKQQKETELVMKKKRNQAMLRLLYTFLLWYGLVMLSRVPLWEEQFASFFIDFTSWATIIMSKILFIPIGRGEMLNQMSFNGFNIIIVFECTAYNFFFFIIALSAFSQWSAKNKFINAGIMGGIIFIVNLFRFIGLGYVGSLYPQYFSIIHDYAWNILFTILTFGLWLWRNNVTPSTAKIESLTIKNDVE